MEMSNREKRRLSDKLQHAASVIEDLRNQNRILAARLNVYDELMTLFRTRPNDNNGLMTPTSPDIVRLLIETSMTLEKEIELNNSEDKLKDAVELAQRKSSPDENPSPLGKIATEEQPSQG